MRGAQSRTSAVEAGAIVTRPRLGCCAAVGMRYIDSAARAATAAMAERRAVPWRGTERESDMEPPICSTGMVALVSTRPSVFAILTLAIAASVGTRSAGVALVGIAPWPDRGAEEEHRHALVVGILAAVRRDRGGHQPLLFRRDDDVAAAAGEVTERGGADQAVARLARRLGREVGSPDRRRRYLQPTAGRSSPLRATPCPWRAGCAPPQSR